MNKQYINIGIAGLSIHDSDQLKHQLYAIFPQHFNIQWKSAAAVNLDCLFIHERFFDTQGIQKILTRRALPWLKISKDNQQSGRVRNNTLFLPVDDNQELNQWIDKHIVSHNDLNESIEHAQQSQTQSFSDFNLEDDYFKKMYAEDNHEKLHLYDDLGTIAVIDTAQNIAWLNLERQLQHTDASFKYDFASIEDMTHVSRKHPVILQDWIWNLFWQTPNFYQTVPEDGHFRILSWPKPAEHLSHKQIFQLSACFIQGAKISTIAEQYDIPLSTVRQFIAANMASLNIKKINLWDKHYTPPETHEPIEEKNFVQNFFSKLRRKFGF